VGSPHYSDRLLGLATLYVVSTPIGNLADLTYRGAEVLARAYRVVAEDTRRTRILLRHYGIETPVTSLHAHNEAQRCRLVTCWLEEGHDVALVADAGTPLICDPGERVVASVLRKGYPVVPIPGPSAVLSALVISGLPTVPFTFHGFPPRKAKLREQLLERIATAPETTVLFEAPNRLVELLTDLARRCGPERSVAVARELTKVHEDCFRGTLEDARRYYERVPPRGEVVVVVGGCAATREGDVTSDAEARALARALVASGKRPSAVARDLVARLGLPRNRAYRIVQSLSVDESR